MYLDFNNINQDDTDSVAKAMADGQTSASAPIVSDFERAMAEYLGVDDCVATNSGTAALHLALMNTRKVCIVGVPALTFAATINVIRHFGAKVTLIDVDLDTWISKKPWWPDLDVFIPVDLYGVSAEHYSIGAVRIIRDSAESLGVKRNPPHYLTKSLGWKYICYSFNGNKVMTTGGGGLVVGGDSDYIRWLSIQGRDPNQKLGFNYRMTGLSAALGLSQLKRLPQFLARKRELNAIYRHYLSDLVKFQEAPEGTEPTWWMTACLFPEEINIEWLMVELAKHEIPTRRIFRPVGEGYFPNAQYIYNHGLCLPSSTLNTEDDAKKVCRVIRGLIA